MPLVLVVDLTTRRSAVSKSQVVNWKLETAAALRELLCLVSELYLLLSPAPKCLRAVMLIILSLISIRPCKTTAKTHCSPRPKLHSSISGRGQKARCIPSSLLSPSLASLTFKRLRKLDKHQRKCLKKVCAAVFPP